MRNSFKQFRASRFEITISCIAQGRENCVCLHRALRSSCIIGKCVSLKQLQKHRTTMEGEGW